MLKLSKRIEILNNFTKDARKAVVEVCYEKNGGYLISWHLRERIPWLLLRQELRQKGSLVPVIVVASSILVSYLKATRDQNDGFIVAFGMLIPRKNRFDIVADLQDDVADWREAGYGERVIRFLVVWHIACHSTKLKIAAVFAILGKIFA